MSGNPVPLYVRLAEEPNRRLELAVSISGKSKRQIVEEAVSEHLGDDGLVVGRATVIEDPNEVMTLRGAAELLRLDTAALKAAAAAGRVPARRIGGKWRFSKSALLAWLDHTD